MRNRTLQNRKKEKRWNTHLKKLHKKIKKKLQKKLLQKKILQKKMLQKKLGKLSKLKKSGKSGTTLVEMIVSMLLLELLAVMVIGVLSPAAKIFVRVQQMQFAQMIVDNVAEEMKSQMQTATGSIKLYDVTYQAGEVDDGKLLGMNPSDSGIGNVLEFMNTYGYVVLMSADGCATTNIVRNTQQQTVAPVAVKDGKLLMRYYWPKMADNGKDYTYDYKQNGELSARTVNRMFTDKYYMGNYLQVEFRFPPDSTPQKEVPYVTAVISLYRDHTCTKLLAQEEAILHIRYKTIRASQDTFTAIDAETNTES